MNFIEGKFNGKGYKIAIVISRFNSLVTNDLLEGAKDCLTRHDVEDNDIDVYFVPGSMEIPFITKELIKKEKYNGVIALSAVIRGETYHFDIVANEVAKGIAQINLEYHTPVSFGVITTETVEQAINRAGLKSGNKGFDAALSLLEIINLKKKI